VRKKLKQRNDSTTTCPTPDIFVTEEFQEYSTPSLRSDDQEHRWATTYTRVVVSTRACSLLEAAYCPGGYPFEYSLT
jgi:hypothetical protein